MLPLSGVQVICPIKWCNIKVRNKISFQMGALSTVAHTSHLNRHHCVNQVLIQAIKCFVAL